MSRTLGNTGCIALVLLAFSLISSGGCVQRTPIVITSGPSGYRDMLASWSGRAQTEMDKLLRYLSSGKKADEAAATAVAEKLFSIVDEVFAWQAPAEFAEAHEYVLEACVDWGQFAYLFTKGGWHEDPGFTTMQARNYRQWGFEDLDRARREMP